MNVEFLRRENGPERLESEAEIIFTEGALQGMKLVGFCVWRGADGAHYVTFPSRALGSGTERRFFDYIRSAAGNIEDCRRLKDWILNEYQASKLGK